MRNLIWCFFSVFPVCAAIVLGLAAGFGADISFSFVFFLAGTGWFIITGYSLWRFIALVMCRMRPWKNKDTDLCEKFFSALDSACEIKERLKSLEKDVGRNIDRLHDIGKKGGYYVKPD